LDIANFPELKNVSVSGVNKSKGKQYNKTNFADMMKNTTQNLDAYNKVTIEEDEIVKPGWVCIKHDVKTNQPKWIYGEGCLNINEQNENDASEVLDEDPFYVFERLTKLYQNRKNDHINKWGYDEYDKMFLFQNYDYEYFDKLDENFEREFSKHYYKVNVNNNDYDYYMDN
jgi:hypothetical protein